MPDPSGSPSRRRPILLAWGAGILAIAVIVLGVNGTLSGWTASITNSSDTAGAGTLVMQETGGSPSSTCNSNDATATCTTIDKYGGNVAMTPGQTATTTVTIANIGTVDATGFTLDPGACTDAPAPANPGDPDDLCSVMTVTITASGTTVYSGTLADFTAQQTLTPLAAGGSQDFTFVVTLPSDAGNAIQGVTVSQPLTWTFTA